MSSLRALEQAHAVASWSAAALLLAASARVIQRRAQAPHALAASLGTVTLTIAAGIGLWLAPPFEMGPRQLLFVRSPSLGWLFERAQHLTVAAVLLAWCATAALTLRSLRSRSALPGGPLDASLDAIAARACLAAFAFAAFAAFASTLVGRVVHL